MNIRAISEIVSDLGESPLWNPQKNCVTWTDITQKVFHVADFDSGATHSFAVPSMIGALAHTRSEDYVAATQEGFALVSVDGKFSPMHSFLDKEMRMNDGKVDPFGRFWAGSFALSLKKDRGILYVLEKDGSYRSALENITLSNGMGWSPDSKYFYYIDSIPGVLKRFDFDSEHGEISNPIDLITFDTSKGIPDGMCVTSNGKLVVAIWDGGRVEIYSPEGNKISEVQVGTSRPTSCMFGGPDGSVLIITTASQDIDRAKEPLAGKVLAVSGTGLSGLPTHQYG